MILDDETLNWIELNAKADASALRLKYAGDSQKSFAILQIECRRKAASKLKETLVCKEFIFPNSLSAEQCTSDILARFHASLIRGNAVLDMTAGLCIDAFHIANTGCKVTAIEQNEALVEAAKHNSSALGIEEFEIINTDSVKWIKSTQCKFDTIFIDPARRGEGGKRIFALSDCAPNVVELLPVLRQKCSRLVVKASPMLDISSMFNSLGYNTAIYITGSPTECKEVVAVIDFDKELTSTISAVTLSESIRNIFTFTPLEENDAISAFSEPAKGTYLYEPYPAAMKSGGFSIMSARFGAWKLDPNTHLYISDKNLPDFPGERFEIIDILPFVKPVIKSFSNEFPVINVSARNFTMKPAELAKKLRIKEGGNMRLFATKILGHLKLIVALPAYQK